MHKIFLSNNEIKTTVDKTLSLKIDRYQQSIKASKHNSYKYQHVREQSQLAQEKAEGQKINYTSDQPRYPTDDKEFCICSGEYITESKKVIVHSLSSQNDLMSGSNECLCSHVSCNSMKMALLLDPAQPSSDIMTLMNQRQSARIQQSSSFLHKREVSSKGGVSIRHKREILPPVDLIL